ncbi:MAG: tRNA-dihydrouridine synthase family protein [Bacteriovoracaceae bacterium]|nr:tRNA-dihydrouridine synthase family protein [Bacteriovoracaceae bacterium]
MEEGPKLIQHSQLNSVWPEVNFPFLLAPMVGLSHVALRELVRDYLPSNARTIWPTEMLNSRRLPTQRVGETPETKISQRDSDLVPQILGNNERFISESIKRLQHLNIAGVDINMGCPVAKALKHNYGVALMGDPEYASSVVAMAKRATDLPVSVKLRVGLQKDQQYFDEFCQGLVDAGARMLCLHPRTAEQKRKGNADWSQIADLKKKVTVPIIGNGDVQVWQDAVRMLEETGCDGVMMGRALTARPWIFWQLGESLGFSTPPGREGERAPQGPEEESKEFGRVIIKYVDYCFKYFETTYALRKIKFYLRVSTPWLNFGHYLCKKLNKCQTPEEYRQVCEEFFGKDGLLLAPFTNLTY